MTDDRRHVAYHEAGHAVAACALGITVVRASIVADGRVGGCVEIDFEGARYVDVLATFMAGVPAELRYILDAGIDRSAALIVESAEGDNAAATQLLATLDYPPGRVTEVMLRESQRAEALLHDQWPAVEAVAQALLSQDELTGDEVARMVSEHPAV